MKHNEFRIIKMTDGKYYAQVYGAMYWLPSKWLTVGSIGTKEVSHWLYPDERMAKNNIEDCKKLIEQYKKDQAMKYGTNEAIEKVIPVE